MCLEIKKSQTLANPPTIASAWACVFVPAFSRRGPNICNEAGYGQSVPESTANRAFTFYFLIQTRFIAPFMPGAALDSFGSALS